MSKENVVAFWQKVEKNQELQEQLAAIPDGERDVMVSDLMGVAAEEGFLFTAEQFAEAGNLDNVPLSDGDLDTIAGGGVCPSNGIMGTFQLPFRFGFRFSFSALKVRGLDGL